MFIHGPGLGRHGPLGFSTSKYSSWGWKGKCWVFQTQRKILLLVGCHFPLSAPFLDTSMGVAEVMLRS